MKRKKIRVIISLFFVLLSMVISPVYVEAKTTNYYIDHVAIKNMAREKTEYEKSCEEQEVCQSDALFGNVECECSVAWLLQKLLNYIKILGPTFAILFGSIDFVKAIITSDEESMKKTEVKFAKRIVAAMVLFFIPLFVEIVLGLFGITGTAATGGLK